VFTGGANSLWFFSNTTNGFFASLPHTQPSRDSQRAKAKGRLDLVASQSRADQVDCT
jgi:hypothetical protein